MASHVLIPFLLRANRLRIAVQFILDIINLMEESLPTRLPIYPLVSLTSLLGTYLFMTWTAESGLAPLVRLLYDQQQIKTFAQELLIVVNTSYYFSLIVIFAFAAAALYRLLFNRKNEGPEPHFSVTTKKALVVSFHTFLIFITFFYFLLRNDGDDLSKRYINLLPFWFLASTVVYLVGEWAVRWAKLRLSLIGIIMNVVLWLLIAGEIYQNGFIQRALNL